MKWTGGNALLAQLLEVFNITSTFGLLYAFLFVILDFWIFGIFSYFVRQ